MTQEDLHVSVKPARCATMTKKKNSHRPALKMQEEGLELPFLHFQDLTHEKVTVLPAKLTGTGSLASWMRL